MSADLKATTGGALLVIVREFLQHIVPVRMRRNAESVKDGQKVKLTISYR
jgi:hypothetical protein